MESRLTQVDERVAAQLQGQEERMAQLTARVNRLDMYMEETQRLQQCVFVLEKEKQETQRRLQ